MLKRTPRIFTATFIVLSFLSLFISCTDEDLLDQLLEAEELYNEEMLLEERDSDSSEEASDEESVVLDEDSDEDGVPDNADKCNNTSKGEDVNEDGCSESQADSDGDGVTDDIDQCPDTGENKEVDEFGCSDAQKDTDGDGISDEIDLCPNTPEDEEANDTGCSVSQKDSDGDGVSDDNDLCPETAENEEVDENGCSASQKDTDNDGVNDDSDKCPNTPEGEEANEQGCSDSQKDSDGDGVSDDNDSCDGTPEGAYVDEQGCADSQKDSDGDGVSDDKDQCNNTPDGAEVDEFGCSDSQTDGDGDGVANDKDACPNTPSGQTVDANGCSATQKDSDKDGVANDADKCANTPSGETVDANGCSQSQKDNDGDGIADGNDKCPNTPPGASVDANGCSASQKDSDNDGVNNDKDECANTPSGETVDAKGCSESQKDTDGDDVPDAVDQCPGTPAGEAVNAQGCSASQRDSDGDGVNDDKDQCANTPSGQTVNANGCAESQKDEDGDGIADSADQCPGTPSGQSVNSTGCSASQRDSDGDGVNDAEDQCANTPSGASVDGNGCSDSQKDSDGDGVTDNNDQCPGTSAGENVDNTGCPVPEDDSNQEGTGNEEFVDYDGLIVNITPCEFSLDTLVPGQTLEINCRIDLKGQTVNLPSSVTLQFNKGEIINGTLNFNGGNIDGRLLNKDLEITGQARLISDNFQFYPVRWDFVQGTTNSDRAQQNTFNLEDLFEFTKGLGARTFLMDKFDAYFEVSKVTSTTTNQNFYPTKEAINVPSDFTLQMSNNTILRVFPTIGFAGTLLGIDKASNVTVRGGVLYGDRDIRNYSGPNAEEGSHLLTIRSGKNILLDGVKFYKGSLGGLNVNSYGFTFNPDYDPTSDVRVVNCLFEKVRMMSVAITDGKNIRLDNNTFIDSSQPTGASDGGVVGYAINIEPVRKRDASGQLVNYQMVSDVTIANNQERNSRLGAVSIYVGDRIIVEGNNFDSKVAYSYAQNCKIRNNSFQASANSAKTAAIIAGGSGVTVFQNEVSGNRIQGYGTAISANHKDVQIFGNQLIDNRTGIQFKEAADMLVYNNIIQSSVSSSRGIMGHIAEMNNIEIYQNQINVQSDALYFVQLNRSNGSENNSVLVYDNDITNESGVTLSNSRGVTLSNNTTNGGFKLFDAEDIEIIGNNIATNNSHGIALRKNNLNIRIQNNIIKDPGGNYSCIYIEDTTNPNNVINENNSCN